MKKLASLVLLCAAATFAFAAESFGQGQMQSGGGGTMEATEVTGRLSNAPHSTAAPAAKASGKTEAFLAKDEKGKDSATTFSSADPVIYLVTKNVAGAKGEKVRVVWVADDTGKALPKGKKITETAVVLPDTASRNPFFNQPAPVQGKFPSGAYHVELYIGATLVKSLKFTVK